MHLNDDFMCREKRYTKTTSYYFYGEISIFSINKEFKLSFKKNSFYLNRLYFSNIKTD